MSFEVDLGLCQGHGKCYRRSPDLFRPIDDHGHAEATPPEGVPIDAELAERVDYAIVNCPEQAIRWVDDPR